MWSASVFSKGAKKVTAIIFDVDDTLYDQLRPFQQAYEKNFDFKLPLEVLFKFSRSYSDQVFDQVEHGKISLLEMQIYRITKALERFNIKITSQQAENFQRDYQFYQGQIELLPEMKEALDLCQSHHFQLGIITNGPAAHQRKKIELLNLFNWIAEENIFISGESGFAKPDSRLFQLAEEKMNLKKPTTYYVGDSFNNDVLGAKRFGWQSIWINHREHAPTNPMILSDFIVDSQLSLKKVLASLILQGF